MSKWPNTAPTVSEDGWTEHFGSYTKKFGFVVVTMTYSSGGQGEPAGFVVRINECILKSRKPDLAKAKAYALLHIVVWCERAMLAAKNDQARLP